MKKTITKTALITLGVSLVLAIAVFGIASFCFPYAMMDFTASIGMETLSGDYAYQEYRRSGSVECLARSFAVAAEKGNDRAAEERFSVLYGEEGSEARGAFEAYCESCAVDTSEAGNVEVSMRSYLLGLASRVKYRLAKTSEEKKAAVCDFAIGATDKSFPQGNPVVYLAMEAARAQDKDFCVALLEKMRAAGFEKNSDYDKIEKILGGFDHE